MVIEGEIEITYAEITDTSALVMCKHLPSNLLIRLPLTLPIFELGTFPFVGMCPHPTALSFEDPAAVDWKDKELGYVSSRLYPASVFKLELSDNYPATGQFTLRSITDIAVHYKTAKRMTAAELNALTQNLKKKVFKGHEFSGYLLSVYYKVRASATRDTLVRDTMEEGDIRIYNLENVTLERIRKERLDARPILFALIEMGDNYIHLPCCCLKYLVNGVWL